MSSIDKLSILGVRSFDNVKSETIQFHKPLTLIVGLNGSGKTTIIECLKYVTTGELPPNSKGGAFVHDPRLCGEKEVLAQVKLSFKSTEGTKMVCTRSLQLTVKKAARTCKELEGSLLMYKNAEKHVVSSRKADLDGIMPSYLGVSKAILSSVIFCHQEDSLWPLSQPAKLKEKFDEIFEALKYTKAIDNIKVLAKKKKTELELLKKDHETAKHNKDRGKKIQKQAEALNAECDEMRNQHADLADRVKQAARNAEAAWEKANKAGGIVSELNSRRERAATKEESVLSLRETLTEMSDSDEALQKMLAQYDERVQHYEADLKAQKERYSELGRDVQEMRNKVSSKERECGSYEAQSQNYDRQVANREKLVKETARSHNMRGFDLELDDDQVAAFVDRITKMAREQNASLEHTRRETQEDLQRHQAEINDLNQQKTAINGRKDGAKQTIATNDRKIGSLQDELNRINIDEGGKAAMESKLLEVESRLSNSKSDHEKADYDNQAQARESELGKLDDQSEKLNSELVEGTKQAGESARLDLIQKDLKERERSLDTMVGAHGGKITSLIGQAWTPSNVESNFQQTLDQSSAEVAEAEKQRDGTSREKDQLDYQLSTCRRDLKAKQQAVKKAAEAIKQNCECEPKEYEHNLRELEQARDNCRSNTESTGRLNSYFDACIKFAKGKNPGCRTCGRAFGKDKEADALVTIIEREKKKLQEQTGDAPEQLEGIEEELQKAKAVASDFEAWERLTEKEVPALEKQLDSLVKKRETLIEELERQDTVVNERETAKRDVDAVSRTVQSIAKLSSEITRFQEQVKELSAKQKSAGLSRGLEQIQDEIRKVNDEARAVKARLAKITSERERSRSNINTLELELRDTKSKLSTAEYQLKEKRSLEGQIEELKGLNNEQRDKLKSFDKELQALVPKLSQAQAKYDDRARNGTNTEREQQAKATKISDSLSQLRLANQEIDAYLARGGPEQLKRGKREVESLKKEVTRLEQDQAQIVREVKSLEDQLRNHSETKRSIADNQRYRRDLRQLEQTREEIAELETHNAEEDKAKYEREGNNWQLQRSKLAAEQASITGSLKSKDEILVSILEDYDTEYKDSARRYKQAHIMVETTKACIEDLGRYGGALDKAIMKYHSLKMQEINRIIDELWRKTYQGTDVDTILIRSESENAKSNKSYNYRVCMMKQDAEMDMRGRCSAGQKVLACIIIRLALAECFGVNCGLIALDEPTTNLDRDNIRALAESLSQITKMRRQQKNFQLIVITHDEEFLRYMGCSDFADVYYRVGRSNTQTSQIERNNIADVI